MISRLGLKLSLLILIVTLAADVLSFSSRIVIDMVISDGNSSTENIIASVVSSIAEMEAAFSRAERVTLVGSTMPLPIMSQ